MNIIFEIILWVTGVISLAALVHTYLLYPLSLIIISTFKKKAHPSTINDQETYEPTITMVCAVYNEEKVIQKKVENFFSLDYPPEKAFLLIGSDGSTDRTHEILQQYVDEKKIILRVFERGGKSNAINRLYDEVHTDLIFFTDANTFYSPETIRKMVRHFSDPGVGGVCGNLRLIPTNKSIGAIGEERYWAFESWLKKMEGSIETTLGATGAVYAIRRELFQPQPVDVKIADDLLLPLRIAAGGCRIAFEEEALVFEETTTSIREEFVRKIRVAIGTFSTVPKIRLFSSRLSGFVRYALFSHKYLRWLVPFFLIGLLISNIGLVLLEHGIMWMMYAQIVFYFIALIGLIAETMKIPLGIFSMPFYFVAINISLLIGWMKLPMKKSEVIWAPTKRN